jgi:hypothetical protein
MLLSSQMKIRRWSPIGPRKIVDQLTTVRFTHCGCLLNFHFQMQMMRTFNIKELYKKKILTTNLQISIIDNRPHWRSEGARQQESLKLVH